MQQTHTFTVSPYNYTLKLDNTFASPQLTITASQQTTNTDHNTLVEKSCWECKLVGEINPIVVNPNMNYRMTPSTLFHLFCRYSDDTSNSIQFVFPTTSNFEFEFHVKIILVDQIGLGNDTSYMLTLCSTSTDLMCKQLRNIFVEQQETIEKQRNIISHHETEISNLRKQLEEQLKIKDQQLEEITQENDELRHLCSQYKSACKTLLSKCYYDSDGYSYYTSMYPRYNYISPLRSLGY